MAGSARGCASLAGELRPSTLVHRALIIASWLACFSTFGYASSFGVYQDLYTLNSASSASSISWIGSLQLSLMFMLGIVSGRLLDQGYFRHITIGGTLLYQFS